MKYKLFLRLCIQLFLIFHIYMQETVTQSVSMQKQLRLNSEVSQGC